jgi:hypothetical protein
MKEENWQKFNISLRSIETRGTNTMEKWTHLSENIKKTIECCFPLKTTKKNYTFTMSIGLLKSRDKKNTLLQKFKKGEIRKGIYVSYNN